DVDLLISIESTCQTPGKNPPLNFVLHLVRKSHPGGIDSARLFQPEIISWKTEPRTQEPSSKIKPASFMSRTLLPSIRQSEHPVRELTYGRKRPRIPSQRQCLLQFRRKLSRFNGRVASERRFQQGMRVLHRCFTNHGSGLCGMR